MKSQNPNNGASSKGTVLVLSRYWPTALSVARSLGAAGFDVDLISSVSEPGASAIAAASRYVGYSGETVSRSVKQSDDPGLLKAVSEYGAKRQGGEKTVLFPVDDYTVSFIDRHKDSLRDSFVFPDAGDGSEGSITAMMNKQAQSRMAKEAGLRCPPEWLISLEDEEPEIPADMIYPCFVKPAESVTGFKGEMAKCDDREALAAHLGALKAKNPHRNVIVQKFLSIDYELDIGGVAWPGGVYIPAVIRKTCVARHERGVTAAGVMMPPDIIAGIYEGICGLFRISGYTGMFDLEINAADGGLYFGELNFRSGGPNYAYYLSGVNLPEAAVRAIRGEEPCSEGSPSVDFGMSFVSEKVIWKEYLKGCMSLPEVRRIIRDSDAGLISDSDDTEPVKLFEAGLRRDMRKAGKKKIKGAGRRLMRPLKPVREMLQGYPQYRPGNIVRKSDAPCVMVMGRNYSSNLCMARSMGMAGYDVEIMRVFTRRPAKGDIQAAMIPDARSRYVRAFRSCTLGGKTQRGADRLMAAAGSGKGSGRKMLLIPTDDISAYVIDESYERLKSAYVMPNIRDTGGELIRLMSKAAQTELARSCGLPVLGSRAVKCVDGRYEIPEGVSYPCFIKPDVSCRSSKKRMKKCGSPEELRDALDEIALTASPDLLIEDHVQIKRELSLLGLCADGKVLCPGLLETTSGGEGARRGVAAAGVSMAPAGSGVINGELKEKLRRFMLRTGYCGLFDIDFIETEDGSIYFLEVNLRYGASGYVVTCEGTNLPGIFADYMLKGMPVPHEEELQALSADGKDAPGHEPVSFVSEKVMLENYTDGAASEEELRRAFDSDGIHFIRSENDPRPYRAFMRAADKIIKKTRRD